MKLKASANGVVNDDCPMMKERERLLKERDAAQDKLDKLLPSPHISDRSLEILDSVIQNNEKLYVLKFVRELARMTNDLTLVEGKQFLEQYAAIRGITFAK